MLLPQKCHGEEWSLDFVKLCKAAMNLKLAHVTSFLQVWYQSRHSDRCSGMGQCLMANAMEGWNRHWILNVLPKTSEASLQQLVQYNWHPKSWRVYLWPVCFDSILFYSYTLRLQPKKCSLIQWSSAERHIEDPSWYLFITRKKKRCPVPEKGSRWVRATRKMRRRYEDPNIVGTLGWKGPPKYIDNLYIWPGVNTFIGVLYH